MTKNIFKKLITALSLVLITSACNTEVQGSSPENKQRLENLKNNLDTSKLTSNFSLHITDAPTADFKAVNISVSGIEIHSNNDDQWIQIPTSEEPFDLLKLNGDEGLSNLIGDLELEKDVIYDRIRLLVKDAQLVLNDDSTVKLKVPSSKLTMKGFELNLTEGEKTALVVDFNAEKSIVTTGSNNANENAKGFVAGNSNKPNFILKPNIKLEAVIKIKGNQKSITELDKYAEEEEEE